MSIRIPQFINDCTILRNAVEFAIFAHAGQVRKYDGEPYVVHPIDVCEILYTAGETDTDLLVAALLHDVVEDTHYSVGDIEEMFNPVVAHYVAGLTAPSIMIKSVATRKHSKQVDLEFLIQQCDAVKTIKIADIISNTKDWHNFTESYCVIYVGEKSKALSHIGYANKTLTEHALSVFSTMPHITEVS